MSVRSTAVSTVPRSVPSRCTRRDDTNTTRSLTAAATGTVVGSAATAATRGVRPRSPSGVPGAAAMPSNSRARSLITRAMPSASIAMTPSAPECNTASCSRISSAISSGSRLRVRRRHRRVSSAEPIAPTVSATATNVTMRTRVRWVA